MRATHWLTGLLTFISAVSLAGNKCQQLRAAEFYPAKMNLTDKNGKIQKDFLFRQAIVAGYTFDAGEVPHQITNLKTKKSCSPKFETVNGDAQDVFLLDDSERILVRSYSGAQHWDSLIDLKTCKTVWESKPHPADNIVDGTLQIESNCGTCDEKGNFQGVCKCQAAEVWKLSKCAFVLDSKASEELTKHQLGVAFKGTQDIENARSTKVRLVK